MRFAWVIGLLLAAAVPAVAEESGRYREDLEVGLTFFDLGQYVRAAMYLDKAYAARPDDPEVAVPYAASLLRTNREAQAIPILEKFDTPEAAYYLGEAYKKKGRTAEARAMYEKAGGASGPLSARALLEAGRLASAAGDYGAARSSFERLQTLDTAGDLVGEARKELAGLKSKKSRFGATAALGVRYDSNVRLAQEPASGDSGFRSVLSGQASGRLLEKGAWKSDVLLSVDTGRFLKPELQPLDFGAQRLEVNLNGKPGKLPVRLGAAVFAQYNTLNFATYSLGFGAGPQALVAEGEHLATSASWAWRTDNFAVDTRDAVVSQSNLSQFIFWGQTGYAGVGGEAQFNRSRGLAYQYRIFTFRGFAGGEVGYGLQLDGGLDFAATPYRKVDRIERTLTGSVGLAKYWGAFGIRGSGAFVSNNTTAAPDVTRFDFHKTVVGLEARVRY